MPERANVDISGCSDESLVPPCKSSPIQLVLGASRQMEHLAIEPFEFKEGVGHTHWCDATPVLLLFSFLSKISFAR